MSSFKNLLPIMLLGTVLSIKAQNAQNLKSNGNTFSSSEYAGTNNDENFTIKTNSSTNTVFKKNGEVKMTSLEGTGNRILYATNNGVLTAYPLGQPGQLLTADGIWVDMPVNYWHLNANGNKLTTSINKVGINTDSPNFTLDVNGDGHFSGNLILNGELIINEKITSPKQLFAKSMEVDSIKMDSGKAIYGETTIKGDVRLKYTLDVLGNAVFHGDQNVDGGIYSSNMNAETINSGIVNASSKLVTNRITYTDSAFHIGDSSMIFITPAVTSNPAGSGITSYDRMYAGSSGLALGTATVAGGSFSTALGHLAKAYGSNSVGIGVNVQAWGATSIAMGNGNTFSKGANSLALGSSVVTDAAATNSLVLGRNLTNVVPNSLMIGLSPASSTIPTLFVGPAATATTTGFVGIGTSTPNTTLHIQGETTISSLGGGGVQTVVVDNDGKLSKGGLHTINWALGGNNITDPTTEYLGTKNQSALDFRTSDLRRMSIDKDGHVIVGYVYGGEQDLLNINAVNQEATVSVNACCFDINQHPIPSRIRITNLWGGYEIKQDENGFGRILHGDKVAMSMSTEAVLIGKPDATWDNSTKDTKLTISTLSDYAGPNPPPINIPLKIINPTLPTVSKTIFEVLADGTTHIGLGRPSTTGAYANAKLTVDGQLLAKEVRVTIATGSAWADYVFDTHYNLMSLADVEKFYISEKHLPNVPSACEVEEKGIDMAEMNAVLLRKIEENTLYLVELKKEIDLLKKENMELKTRK